MFSASLPPLQPPPTSLLPSLSRSTRELNQHSHPQNPANRRKQTNLPPTPLVDLTHDERNIVSRKLAIAMFGYSWLKPAGCTKTMLGRREEELEREEVERQLREVEAQERMVMEQEEQERREELRRQAANGETEGAEERDLDEDVPEAVEEDEDEEEVESGDAEGEEEMEGDLDDDVPEASEQESSWMYDTRRETETESEDGDMHGERNQVTTNERNNHLDSRLQLHPSPVHRRHLLRTGSARVTRETTAVEEETVNSMLEEEGDELGEYGQERDLDEDLPDMDMDMDMDADLSDRDLDGDIPSAEDEGRGWEHTDSELEESSMDISLLPPHPSVPSRNPGTTHEEMRRVSGNRMIPPPRPLVAPTSTRQSSGSDRHERNPVSQHQSIPTSSPPPPQAQRREARTGQLRTVHRSMMQTPATDDEVSALISTGPSSSIAGMNIATRTEAACRGANNINSNMDGNNDDREEEEEEEVDEIPEQRSPTTTTRRHWLNAAGARRNLFSGFRGGTTTGRTIERNQADTAADNSGNRTNINNPNNPNNTTTTMGSNSSGGLFTPNPTTNQLQRQARTPEVSSPDESPSPPRSRTRSGRLLGGIQIGRRTRRGG